MLRSIRLRALTLCCALLVAPLAALADDIDIFIGASGGAAAAPKVMILMDNSLDWVADLPAGKSKFDALSAVLGSITPDAPVSVGLALFTPPSNPTTGAYIRFAPRDMSVDANRLAFRSLLNVISADANVGREANGRKDESAALYEIFKYYSGLAPRSGSSNTTSNPYVDKAGNIVAGYPRATAADQVPPLTSGFAFALDGTYDSKATACSTNYIIYIVANNAGAGATGAKIYEGKDSGALILPAPGAPDTYADEWARVLNAGQSPKITTYVLDAYFPDDNQDAGYSASLAGMASSGGGSYKHVRNQADIYNELLRIFAEIKSVNSAFASASLPVNATNRAQNLNQVFIGMFRPDPAAKPRWFGNLKQYQLVLSGGSIILADAGGAPAINPLTGFLGACATSFWTTDSSLPPPLPALPPPPAPAPPYGYWKNVATNPSPAGKCPISAFDPYSDSPDGDFVEKGAVAEVLRKGNNPVNPVAPATTPPNTNTTPTFAVNRKIYSLDAANTLKEFKFNTVDFPVATYPALTAPVVAFTRGEDVNDENANGNVTETRPSIHGDVIHSRPLPLNYGGTTGVVVYYGANDGDLRAVDASTGQELWAFIAPEFFDKLGRQKDQSPAIAYPNMPAVVPPVPAPTPKGYFFDGSIGAFQSFDSANKVTQAWIYPSMRRGGRMLYAFDVTNVTKPVTPAFKWKAGCPNPADDALCSTGMTGIGQTWSLPAVAFIKGYSTTNPVIVIGGGYDPCEDQNSAAPACGSAKGAAIYILDAFSGTVLARFGTTRSVPADVALIDIDSDGFVDYAFAVDTGGNIYRADFVDGPASRLPLAKDKWVMRQVAFTNGAGRKFLFPPALLLNSGKVYVAIGSGDREHPLISQYPYLGVINRFYMYVDDLSPVPPAPGTTPPAVNLDDTTVMLDKTKDLGCSLVTNKPVTPTSIEKGWFVTLNENGTGEQVVTSAVIGGGLVTFSTNRPIPAAAGSCSTTLGEARGYFLNVLTGSGAVGTTQSCGGVRSGIFAGGGLPPSPVLGTIPVGGKPKTVVIGAIQRSGGSSSAIAPQQLVPPIGSRRSRVYWYTPGADN